MASKIVERVLGSSPRVTDAGLLLLRLWVGVVLAAQHGFGKFGSAKFVAGLAEDGMPAPEVFATLAALAEFVGGICIALGLLTRPAALTVVVTMGVAALVHHAPDPFGKAELAYTYGVVALMLVVTGAGRFSIDELIRRRLRRSTHRGDELPTLD